jgi:hypothetical protein
MPRESLRIRGGGQEGSKIYTVSYYIYLQCI